MKKAVLSIFAVIAINFASFSQDLGAKAFSIISECACREVILNSRGVDKPYSAAWLESVKLEDGFLTFSKGENVHRWNVAKITFIEKGNGFVRIYLD